MKLGQQNMGFWQDMDALYKRSGNTEDPKQ